jgi:2,5-diamino-6-(ribosylamino)-4(3H)-pyrimidinone 5'-phosphate reductase
MDAAKRVTRPNVLVNMAVTADGKIDTFERRGARISSPADRARVDRLRAEVDAVMVGGHTLLREDPRLTVRDPALAEQRRRDGREPQPMKVAAVSRIDPPGGPDALPTESRFLADGGATVRIYTTTRSDPAAIAWLEAQGARVTVHDTRRVDLEALLVDLADDGIGRLLVEGGGTIVASLLASGLVDGIELAVAPVIFGGETAPTPVGGSGWRFEEAIPLTLADATLDDDGGVLLRYHIERDPLR